MTIVQNCNVINNRTIGGQSGQLNSSIDGCGGTALGGGVYCDAGVEITNCTVIDNMVIEGIGNDPPAVDSGGGGIRGTAATTIMNCILWSNDDDLYGCSAMYSCIQDGDAGEGNIDDEPYFVTGPLGDYYLSQIAAGQAVDSPCVDAGSDTSANLGMDIFTSRTDELKDKSIVDMGYHYSISPASPDIDENLHVDWFDYSILAADWQKCSEVSYLPGDINKNECVEINDIKALVTCWLDCYVTEATNPGPVDQATHVDPNGTLSWWPGEGALYHDIYLGTDANAVANADHLSPEFMGTVSEAHFDPCGLELETIYYWRIDEVGPVCMTQGDVWCFTTWIGLISWWEFDEGSGSIAYDSAGENDGTISGATWTSGQIGGALDFDGVDDYVLVSDSDSISVGNQDYTICAWIYQKSVPPEPAAVGVVSKVKDGADKEYCFSVYNGGLRLDVETNSNNQFAQMTTSPVTVNSWQFIVVAFDSSSTTPTFYHNGQFQPSDNIIDTLPDSLSDDLYIGLLGGIYQSNPFDGMIDDVRIYDRALTAGEIMELYQEGLD